MSAETTDTIPVPDPMVMFVTSLLLHDPPDVASLSVMFDPLHNDVGPVIAAGNGLTVIGEVTRQPVDRV